MSSTRRSGPWLGFSATLSLACLVTMSLPGLGEDRDRPTESSTVPRSSRDAEAQRKAIQPRNIAEGTSSKEARADALAGIPIDKMDARGRKHVHDVIDNISFFRRLPTLAFPVEPEAYAYFATHPDVTVSLWRSMKISKVKMWKSGENTWEADAGDGSVGIVSLLYQDESRLVAVCDGLYKSPLSRKPIQAKTIIVLKQSFMKEANGTIYVTHRADLFVAFPSVAMEAVSKVISPLTVMLTDSTFNEMSLFLKMISVAMARRPDWVADLISNMDGVTEAEKQHLHAMTSRISTAAEIAAKTAEKPTAEQRTADGRDGGTRR